MLRQHVEDTLSKCVIWKIAQLDFVFPARFRIIAIANADAGANAMFETAVEQGQRAVTELM